MGTQQASVLQDNLPALQAQVLSSKGLTGSQSPSPEPLNVKFDLTRLGVGDENRSPNDNSFRETTPNIDLGISLVNKALESPYSPHSNPFGKRPSQRTPGALAFVRRLSELKSPSTEAELDTMGGEQGGAEEVSAWQPSPEMSAEDVQSSWDAVGRMGENLSESAQTPLPKLPNLAAVQEASHLAELAESELALTWTGPRIVTEEAPSSWRKRISNPTFHGTPSPTSSRASSASEPLLNAAGFSGSVRAARGSPAAVDSGVSSPFRTPRGAPHHPQVSPPTEDALRSSAEVFPRSFRIQRTGSSDSLASLLSMTSDITARESSFEAAREASALETILEPGETPERRREGIGYFQSAGANPAQLVLGDVLPVPRPEGPETPRAQVLRVEGAFASPIEVQAAQGPSVELPMALDIASVPELNAAAASAWLQQQGAATPFAQLRQPSSLTPVIKAQAAHAQMTTTREQHGSLRGRALAWSTVLVALQLLLILAPFALILCAPALLPTLPNLGSHPTVFPKASSLSSAATFPGMTGGRAAGPAWWAKPWVSPLGPFGGGRTPTKSPSGPLNTAVDFFHRLFRQETPQTAHAFFGLLPKASHAAPTPHLDKLLSCATSWWSGVTGKLARPAAATQPPKTVRQPRAKTTTANAGPKPQTPAQQSLERAQHLKPKVSAAPPAAPVPAQASPAAVANQVTPKAAPSTERKQPAPTTQPPQQPHLPQAEPPVQQKTPSTPMQKAPQQGIGAQPRQLAASTLRAVQRLKRGAADATEGLLLRGRALLPRSLSSLPRFVQAHGQGITAAAAITVLVGILVALVAAAAGAPSVEEPPSDGVLAPSTPAASVPPATAGPIFEAPRTTLRRGGRSAAAVEGTPAQMRRAPRQAPAASMPPPATPKATAGRAARTAPVSAGLAPEKLASTADTPALRTRARTRRTAN